MSTMCNTKKHMLCSLCCCVARHERPFWIPGTRFLSGFSFDCIDICNRFRLAPRTLIIWCLVVRVRKMRVKAQPNAASKVHKSDLRFYRKIKLMEMACELEVLTNEMLHSNQRNIKSEKGSELSCKCYSSFPQKTTRRDFCRRKVASRDWRQSRITLEPWQWLRRT